MTSRSTAIEAPKAPNTRLIPTWQHETELHSRGFRLLAGVDEAGRGAWAGPLVAAAVIFPHPSGVVIPKTARQR